jgi:hypothetical protein
MATIDIIMIKAVDQMELEKLEDGINQDILDRKIDFATAGVRPYIHRDLTENVSPKNALTVAEHILAMKTENNLSDSYRSTTIELLYQIIIPNSTIINRFYSWPEMISYLIWTA